MQQLCLINLDRIPADRHDPRAVQGTVRIDEAAGKQGAFGLWITAQGELSAAPLPQPDGIDDPSPGDSERVGALKCIDENGTPTWYVARCGKRLGLNGAAPPLALARLSPGALLSVDHHFWLVANVWQPVPHPAPAELADNLCPVCGEKLSEAPVVPCAGPGCGRWAHLERPEKPDDEEDSKGAGKGKQEETRRHDHERRYGGPFSPLSVHNHARRQKERHIDC